MAGLTESIYQISIYFSLYHVAN